MTTKQKERCAYPGCITILHEGHEGGRCYVHEEDAVSMPFDEEPKEGLGSPHCSDCGLTPVDTKGITCLPCRTSRRRAKTIITELKRKNFRILIQPTEPITHPTPEAIIRLVANAYGLPAEKIWRPVGSNDKITWVRQLSVYLIYADLALSADQINDTLEEKSFGCMRVKHSIRKVEGQLEHDPRIHGVLAHIRGLYQPNSKEAMAAMP